jgi:hypothetical protein
VVSVRSKVAFAVLLALVWLALGIFLVGRSPVESDKPCPSTSQPVVPAQAVTKDGGS